MAELPTVEIHSPKDHAQKWIINEDDFDSSTHVRWGDPVPANAPDPGLLPLEERVHHPVRPSAPDFIMDEQGNIVAVNIINPDQRQARKEIPFEEYDPDSHELWSSHGRFQ